jgi:hypothetical protein
LDADGWGTTNGTQTVIWDCTGGANQQWNGNVDGAITSALSGTSGLGSANGTKLLLWSCTGQSDQQWRY